MNRRFGLPALMLICLMNTVYPIQSRPSDETVLHPKDIFVLPHQTGIPVFINLGTPSHFNAGTAETAIRGAVSLWNRVLTGGISLNVSASGSNLPRDQMFITIEAGSDPNHFRSSGHELAYTTMLVIRSRRIAQVRIQINDTQAGLFSTDGRQDGTYDLFLVVLHELGHALGADHDGTRPHYPPVMSPTIGTNLEMKQWTGQNIPDLRKLYSQDEALMQAALKKNETFIFKGTYEGKLTYTSPAREVDFKDFVIDQTKEKITLQFAGNTADARGGIDLYTAQNETVELTEVDGWIKKARIKKNGPDLEVELTRTAGVAGKEFVAKGTLRKIR